jgi:hypothetical protein
MSQPQPHPPGTIFRGFFAAGMVTALAAGALLGSWLMLEMGRGGSYFAPGIHVMNAHAHAMIYGFVGAFVMGFGYQALPRFRGAALSHPRLAAASLPLLLAGLAGSFFGEFLGHAPDFSVHPLAAASVLVGNGLELAAFGVFAFVMFRTLGAPRRVHERFVLASALWFVLSLALGGAYYVVLLGASDFGDVVARVSAFQDPLRNLQLFGAITLVVFGVMLHILPAVFGFKAPGERLFSRLLWLFNGALLLMVVAFPLSVAARRGWLELPMGALRGAYYLGALALAGSLLAMSLAFRPFSRVQLKDRSVKFVRAAHFWLLLSLLMLVLEPLYIGLVVGGFGHGYHGGMRHALTLGFIAMMIVAASAKVVPRLTGHEHARLPALSGVFALLNLAIVWRIGVEIASDFNPALLAWLAPSGAAVLLGLGLWAFHLARLMLTRAAASAPVAPVKAPPPPPRPALDPDLSVAEVARRFPATVPVFSELCMDACCGGAESVAVAAEHNGHRLADVLARLDRAITENKS